MDGGVAFFIILWVVFAIICGSIASAKGRSSVTWAILGFIGGLISMLILACLPKIEPMKKCPNCANEVKQEAMACYHCGKEFFKRVEQ
jgi:hypothetical protein